MKKERNALLKRSSTIILRIALASLGLAVLALCVCVLPVGIREAAPYRPIFLMMYVSAVPFYIALYQAWKLLQAIDKDTAFAATSIQALRAIKWCAIVISTLYALSTPLLYHLADIDDAPGVLALGLVIIFAAVVVATFGAVLQVLLERAVTLKSENDLTV